MHGGLSRSCAQFQFGLLIGMGATTLLLTGLLVSLGVATSLPTDTSVSSPPLLTFTPFPSATFGIPTIKPPTNTYTPTPTYILPTPTATTTNTPTITPTIPSPTPTIPDTITELYKSGYLSLTGPLTLEQQINVYEAAGKYIRQTSEESLVLGEAINGPGYGAPSGICGPLSIAILQDAGIIDPELDPHTYWFLNPKVWEDRKLLEKAFPAEKFESIRVQVKLDRVDWHETPLFPGDFVYLYAGGDGNFEHMLVVSRIDSEGRAYAVTNHNTEDGFVITEILLYHPDVPNVGMFPAWTERPNRQMGATGFGGFEVWRMRAR